MAGIAHMETMNHILDRIERDVCPTAKRSPTMIHDTADENRMEKLKPPRRKAENIRIVLYPVPFSETIDCQMYQSYIYIACEKV